MQNVSVEEEFEKAGKCMNRRKPNQIGPPGRRNLDFGNIGTNPVPKEIVARQPHRRNERDEQNEPTEREVDVVLVAIED